MYCDSQARSGRAAFTLAEIMIVLVIIGLLATLVTVNVNGYLVKARQTTARKDVATLCDALDAFRAVNVRYPTNEEGLAALTKPTAASPDPLLKAGQNLVDPWGRPYQYNQPGRNGPYEVFSYGADGRSGGEGEDADINSWDLKK